MNRVTVITFLGFSLLRAGAEDLYVARTAAGADDGSSCANAKALSWLNSSGNWGVGANKVSAGDTVHLCGVFTNELVIAGSGTVGSPVIVIFENGASFTWGQWASTGALRLNGQSYITIDGGVNGIIQNTNNGTGLVNSNASNGLTGEAYFTVIKNLTITNIYRRFASDDEQGGGSPISISGSSLTISNCTVSDGNSTLTYNGPVPGQSFSNIFFLGNKILNWNHGITIGIGNQDAPPQNAVLKNVIIASNYFDHADLWDGQPGVFHQDGIIVFNATVDPTVMIIGMKTHDNYFGPNFRASNVPSHGATAAIAQYLFGQGEQLQNNYIWNNLFETYDTNGWANGFINAGGSNLWVFNNTSIALGSNRMPRGAQGSCTGSTNIFNYNNIFVAGSGPGLYGLWNTNITIGSSADTNLFALTNYMLGVWSDYNSYQRDTNDNIKFSLGISQNLAAGNPWGPFQFDTIWKWQTWIGNIYSWPVPYWNQTHADPHSQTNAPAFNSGTYVPAISDLVVVLKGTNLTAVLPADQTMLVDRQGVARPSSGPWTIGANNPADDGSGGPDQPFTAGTFKLRGIRLAK